jgi:radical SAM superfamily enzyme YgiQ (UPF0313 family)
MAINSVMLVRVSSVVDKEVDHPQFYDPPYALKHIQADLMKYDDMKVDLLDCWIDPIPVSEMIEQIDRVNPELIVISSSSFDAQVASEVVGILKTRLKSPVIIGVGQSHYLNKDLEYADEDHYDAILLGEVEEEFFRLFDRICNEDNGWREYYRSKYDNGERFVIEDPDSLAFPTYTPDELESYRSIFPVQVNKRVVWGYLIATRGCPHSCVFCSEVMRVSIGRKLRCRSAENVANEIEHQAKMGVNIISFQDDCFLARRSFVEELCNELIERKNKIPWMARVRVDEIDYEVLLLMKKAGCIMLGIGVESGSQRVIEQMEKQRTNKPWLKQCQQAFEWTRRLGIGTNAYYVIGNPTETEEEIKQTIKLAMQLKSDTIQVHYYTPYPGSKAWQSHKDTIAKYDPTLMFHYAKPLIAFAEVSVDQLVKLRSEFYRRYIMRPSFCLTHFSKHAGFYLHNRDILSALLGIKKVFS